MSSKGTKMQRVRVTNHLYRDISLETLLFQGHKRSLATFSTTSPRVSYIKMACTPSYRWLLIKIHLIVGLLAYIMHAQDIVNWICGQFRTVTRSHTKPTVYV